MQETSEVRGKCRLRSAALLKAEKKQERRHGQRAAAASCETALFAAVCKTRVSSLRPVAKKFCFLAAAFVLQNAIDEARVLLKSLHLCLKRMLKEKKDNQRYLNARAKLFFGQLHLKAANR